MVNVYFKTLFDTLKNMIVFGSDMDPIKESRLKDVVEKTSEIKEKKKTQIGKIDNFIKEIDIEIGKIGNDNKKNKKNRFILVFVIFIHIVYFVVTGGSVLIVDFFKWIVLTFFSIYAEFTFEAANATANFAAKKAAEAVGEGYNAVKENGILKYVVYAGEGVAEVGNDVGGFVYNNVEYGADKIANVSKGIREYFERPGDGTVFLNNTITSDSNGYASGIDSIGDGISNIGNLMARIVAGIVLLILALVYLKIIDINTVYQYCDSIFETLMDWSCAILMWIANFVEDIPPEQEKNMHWFRKLFRIPGKSMKEVINIVCKKISDNNTEILDRIKKILSEAKNARNTEKMEEIIELGVKTQVDQLADWEIQLKKIQERNSSGGRTNKRNTRKNKKRTTHKYKRTHVASKRRPINLKKMKRTKKMRGGNGTMETHLLSRSFLAFFYNIIQLFMDDKATILDSNNNLIEVKVDHSNYIKSFIDIAEGCFSSVRIPTNVILNN